MKERFLQDCSDQVDILVDQWQRLFESSPQKLDFFSHNIGHRVYDFQLYNRSIVLPTTKKLLYDIWITKKQICECISNLLLTDPAFFVHNMFYTKKICSMKLKLLTVESNVFNYPLLKFIENIIQNGTIIDIIWTIERLNYDLVHYDIQEDPWCSSIDTHIKAAHPDKLKRAIQSLITAFEARYSPGAYTHIQNFKEKYLQTHMSMNTIMNIKKNNYIYCPLDEVLSKEEYMNFFVALESALFKNIFPWSKEFYEKELENIMPAFKQ